MKKVSNLASERMTHTWAVKIKCTCSVVRFCRSILVRNENLRNVWSVDSRIRQTWVWIPAPVLTGWIILDKLLNLYVSLLSPVNGAWGQLWGWMESEHTEPRERRPACTAALRKPRVTGSSSWGGPLRARLLTERCCAHCLVSFSPSTSQVILFLPQLKQC